MKEGIPGNAESRSAPSVGGLPEASPNLMLPRSGTAPVGSRLVFSDSLPSVRKQLEALEEWVKSQLARQQRQSEQFVESTLRPFEARVQDLEQEHQRLETSCAQHGGGLKGLAAEFTSQMVRVDELETRQWEWRQSVEESLRARLGELERQLKNCATNAFKQCVSTEGALYRESARLQALEERHGGSDLGASRMTKLEEHAIVVGQEVERLHQVLQAFNPDSAAGREETQWEQRAAGVVAKIDPFLKELDNVQALSQEQEIRLSAVQLRLDTQERRTQSLMDRFEAIDMEGHFIRVQDEDHMLDVTMSPKALFEDGPASAIYDAAVQLHAEQWLRAEERPARSVEGNRELLGLCETLRPVDWEEGDES